MDDNFTIECVCLFCGATLTQKEGTELKPGILIKCSSCGEENDYDSVIEVAKEKGLEQVKEELHKHLYSTFKSLFK